MREIGVSEQNFHSHAKVSQKGAKMTREVRNEVGMYAVKKNFYFFFSFYKIRKVDFTKWNSQSEIRKMTFAK